MAKATKLARGKKKHWLKIYSCKPFYQSEIGETYVAEAGLAIGKPVTVNLMNLTGNIKNQNSKINFLIDNVSEGKAYTKVAGYEMITAALKRMVRRRSSKIDMSFTATTSDAVKLRIKPFILTRGKVSKSVLTAIRKKIKEEIKKKLSETGYQNLIQEITNHRFQIGFKKLLAKIHPIKTFEIKSLKAELEKKGPVKLTRKERAKEVSKKEKKSTSEIKESKSRPDKEPAETKEKLKEKEAPEKEPSTSEIKESKSKPDKEPAETKEKLKEKEAPEKEPSTSEKELKEKSKPDKEPAE